MPELLRSWRVGPPRPAKVRPYPYFPLPGHRDMAAVMHAEQREAEQRGATVLNKVCQEEEKDQ